MRRDGGLEAIGVQLGSGCADGARRRERLYIIIDEAPSVLPRSSRDRLQEFFLTRTAEEWEAWARERDLPISALRAAASMQGDSE